eukprot:11590562-Karenia_brevis.AAC.1
MTAIEGDFTTHFNAGSLTENTLDHIYVSLPAFFINKLHVTTGVVDPAQSLARKGISDHAPLFCSLALRGKRAADGCPIPISVMKDA